jgi:chromosome segregation ATPase
MSKTNSEIIANMYDKLVDMSQLLTAMDKKLDDKADKTDITRVENTIDDFAGHLSGYEQELTALNSQTSRHETQIEYLADTMGADLNLAEA